jgi:DNA-binding CsgD family transcriptional regulator
MSLVSAVVVLVTFGFAQGFWISNLHNGLLALAFAGVGAYVLLERPGNREGTLFMATGVVEAVIFLGRQTGHSSSILHGDWWGWFGVWPVVVALALTTFAVLCFPDGRLPSPRWRPVAVAVVAATGVCAALSALWPVEYGSAGLTTPHPVSTSTPAVVADVWSTLAHPVYIALQALWVVAVVVRWRSAGGHQRRQLAWLALAAGVSAVALAVGLAGWGSPRAGILSATLIPLTAGWAVVNGQRLASHSALTWLSRSRGESEDLSRDVARAAAEALGAPGATLWMGAPEDLHLVGVWPDTDATVAPSTLWELSSSPALHVRPVRRGAAVVGAFAVRRPQRDPLSLSETRLLDDLAAQAALVLAHQSLAEIIEREQSAGHLDGLSPREQEVLRLIARGLSNAAICEELHLSIKTVEPLVSTVFSKLGLHADAGSNRRVLAALAYVRG